MADNEPLIQPDRGQDAISLHLVNRDGFPEWVKKLSITQRTALEAQKFEGSGYQVGMVTAGLRSAESRTRRSFRAGAWPNWRKHCPLARIAALRVNPALPCTAGRPLNMSSIATSSPNVRSVHGSC